MVIEFVGRTDVGVRREHNEDALLLAPEPGVFAVADGMGGHAAGEVASRIAIETLSDFFRERAFESQKHSSLESNDGLEGLDELASRIVVALRLANQRIREAARENAHQGMGTTCVAALMSGDQARIAWVGDSRAYVLRGSSLLPATTDHSLANEFLRTGRLQPEDLEFFEHRNVITRALGADDHVDVDVTAVELEPDDVILLCSDGLTGMVSDEEIADVLLNAEELEGACQELIERANEAGGDDNITVVLVRWPGPQ